jgi:uncharacterized membrane protein
MFSLMNRIWAVTEGRYLNSWIKLVLAAGVAAIVMLLVGPACAQPVSAPLTFCNQTSFGVSVAAGYYSQGVNDPSDHSVLTGPLVSRGWWKVDPGQCVTLGNPFAARYMFWYAAGKGYNDGDLATYALEEADLPGRMRFCIPDYFTPGTGQGAFEFEDQNASHAACHANGRIWVLVNKVDTAVDPTVNFRGHEGNY